MVVERTLIRPPDSQIGPITAEERAALIAASPMEAKYATRIDRDSAHEMLARRATEPVAEPAAGSGEGAQEREFNHARRFDGKTARGTPPRPTAAPARSRSAKPAPTLGDAIGTAVIKELQGTTGRRIVRGILGGVFKGR
jgi:hypothetical protein